MEDLILAVVVTRANSTKVIGAGYQFIAEDEAERQRTALLLSRILKAMSHDLENGVTVVVKHG